MRPGIQRLWVTIPVFISLGLTGLTVWAVARQGRALRERELADLRALAAAQAAQRRAALLGDVERALETIGRAWEAGGAGDVDAWAAAQTRWWLCAVTTDGNTAVFPRTPLEAPLPAPDTQPGSHRDLLSRLQDLQQRPSSPDPVVQAGTLLAIAACEQQLGHPLAAARILADAAQLLRSNPRLAALAFQAEIARVESFEAAGDLERARATLGGLMNELRAQPAAAVSRKEVEPLAARVSALAVTHDDPLEAALRELRDLAERRAAAVDALIARPLLTEAGPVADEPEVSVLGSTAGHPLVVFGRTRPSGPRVAVVCPADELWRRYWPEADATWQLTAAIPAPRSIVLAELGPLFGDAVLVPSAATTARLEVVARRQWGLVLAAALGAAGGWGLVLWMMLGAVARQRELARLQGRFVADVSHELKTPLALIRLLSETLTAQRVRDPQRVQAYHETITREAERLTVLLDNILDLGRIESGRKKYEFGMCDVGQVAREAWALFEPRFAEEGFERHLDIAPHLPVIRADAQALHQVIVNLLQNAHRYAGQGKYARLAVRREGFVLLITVEDHGIGMDAGQLRRLGESFFRADDTRVRQQRGAGLGLAIVNHIVTAHGGKIDVQSRPGQGSTFTVWIPFGPDEV